MSFEDCLNKAVKELEAARQMVQAEISAYPTPIAGCDAQFNHLIELRRSIVAALQALDAPNAPVPARTRGTSIGVGS